MTASGQSLITRILAQLKGRAAPDPCTAGAERNAPQTPFVREFFIDRHGMADKGTTSAPR